MRQTDRLRATVQRKSNSKITQPAQAWADSVTVQVARRQTEGQTGRQTDRQGHSAGGTQRRLTGSRADLDGQTDRATVQVAHSEDRQAGRQTDRQTHRQTGPECRWHTVKALPGALRLLRHLHGNRIPIAIATSTSRASLQSKVATHTGLEAMCQVRIGGL